MNSEDLTLPLNEPVTDAPSTQPLLKEIVADIRELKANSVTKTEFAYLVSIVERIENELVKINARLEGIESEQKLMRHGMSKVIIRQAQSEERIMELEKEVLGDYKIAA